MSKASEISVKMTSQKLLEMYLRIVIPTILDPKGEMNEIAIKILNNELPPEYPKNCFPFMRISMGRKEDGKESVYFANAKPWEVISRPSYLEAEIFIPSLTPQIVSLVQKNESYWTDLFRKEIVNGRHGDESLPIGYQITSCSTTYDDVEREELVISLAQLEKK